MSEKASSGGIGFFGMLTILFIGLKLTGFIDWSWWLVLLPILIPLGIIALALLFIITASILVKVQR
jgi:hypothetical protein